MVIYPPSDDALRAEVRAVSTYSLRSTPTLYR